MQISTIPIAMLLAAQVAAQAGEPLVADRPDTTETALVVPRGMVQVESGYTYSRSGTGREHAAGEILVRVPVCERAELRFGVPSYLFQRTGGVRGVGLDDFSLGAKFALVPGGGKKPALAFFLSTTLPTGAKSVAENAWQPEAMIAAQWQLRENLAFTSNLGYTRASDGGVRFDQLRATGSFGFSLSDKWSAFAEIFAADKTDAAGKSAKYADTGLTYLVNDGFQLDARVGIGLNNHVGGPDYFWGMGASRRF